MFLSYHAYVYITTHFVSLYYTHALITTHFILPFICTHDNTLASVQISPVLCMRHFLLNLTCHLKLHDLFTFLQEVIFEIPGESQKKSARLSNLMAAIEAATTAASGKDRTLMMF